jgi:hypothetical protein
MPLDPLMGMDKDFFEDLNFVIPNVTLTTDDHSIIDLIAYKDNVMIGLTEHISFNYSDLLPIITKFTNIFPDAILAGIINYTPRWFKRINGEFYIIRPFNIIELKQELKENLTSPTADLINSFFQTNGLKIEFSEGK